MHHLLHKEDNQKSPSSKSHMALVLLGLFILFIVVLHVGAALSVYETGFAVNNLVVIFIGGILLIVAIVKLRYVMRQKHSKKVNHE